MKNLKILPSKTRNLLEELSKQDFVNNFYLAGGTALVLEFSHRISNDLDFFSEEKFNINSLKRNLKKIGKWEASLETEDTLIGYFNQIKISFFYLPYKLIDKPGRFNRLKIAGLIDIALMKILAISQRTTKRYFVDIYILAQQFMSLTDLIKLFPKKFGQFDYNLHHIIKSLVYFDEVERDRMPRMLINLNWLTIKEFFVKEQGNLLKILTR